MRDIFEDMRALVGCDYISDLRRFPDAVQQEFRHLSLRDYPLMQLNDFIQYIYGSAGRTHVMQLQNCPQTGLADTIGGKENIMSRFIRIDQELININFIVSVTNNEDGTIEVFMNNDTHFTTSEDNWGKIIGYDHIVALTPCENLCARAIIRGNSQLLPVQYMAVTASGDIRPMSKDLVFIDSIQGVKLTGYECGEDDEDFLP